LIPAGTGFSQHQEKRRSREILMQPSEAEKELFAQLSEVEVEE